MSKVPARILALPLHERALIALRAAVNKAYARAAREGRPMYIWRDGKVVRLSPKEVRQVAARKR